MQSYLLIVLLLLIPSVLFYIVLQRICKSIRIRYPFNIAISIAGALLLQITGLLWCYQFRHPHPLLKEEITESNYFVYSAKNPPTGVNKALAEANLRSWKTMSASQQHSAVDVIISESALLGMSKNQVSQYLGMPKTPFEKEWDYDIAQGESECRFYVIFDDEDKVLKTYLRVNY